MARGPRRDIPLAEFARNEPADVTELRRTLARHGFVAAASGLRPFDRSVGIPNITQTIKSWDNYPKNLEFYPKQLRKRTFI